MSCGVGCRCGSDPELLWLWCRLAATAPVGPLAWELPYAMGSALKKKKTKNKKNQAHKFVSRSWMNAYLALEGNPPRG